MSKQAKAEAWAIRFQVWKPTVDRYADQDPATQQDEVFQRAPTLPLALALGRKLAAQEDNTSPGHFDLMRGTPDPHGLSGWDWSVAESFW
jgi:hypothetical protein